jgi:hypothetical protein
MLAGIVLAQPSPHTICAASGALLNNAYPLNHATQAAEPPPAVLAAFAADMHAELLDMYGESHSKQAQMRIMA